MSSSAEEMRERKEAENVSFPGLVFAEVEENGKKKKSMWRDYSIVLQQSNGYTCHFCCKIKKINLL
jgi:hypothetical protein